MLPEWLRWMLTKAASEPRRPAASIREEGRLAALVRTVETAPEGKRNAVLYWAACRGAELVAEGAASAEAVAALLCSAAVAAGLPEAEARRTVDSAMGGR
jgi:hypothetical protein